MQLGISTWSLPWSIGVPGYPQPPRPLDAFGLVDKAAALGIGLVQIADNLPWPDLAPLELEHLKKEAEVRRISLEVGTRGVEPEHLARCARVAEELGAGALRTVFSGTRLGADHLAKAEWSIRQVLPELQARKVTLALENNEAFSAAQFSQLMRDISSPYVGMCLDTANSLGRPEPLEMVLGQLGAYVVMLHAKDYDIKRVDTRMGFSVVGQPAGEGRVDFDQVLTELRQRGRDDISVIIEHWPPFEGSIEATVRLENDWLARSAAFLRPRVEKSQVPRRLETL